jgi:uncharacterized protein with NRDE domain
MQRARLGKIARAACVMAPSSQLRSYEYWGLHTSPRAQPYAAGDSLNDTMQLHGGVDRMDKEGQYLTGNGMNKAWDVDLLTDRVAENNMWKNTGIYFRHIDKWIIHDVTTAECQVAAAIFAKFNKQDMWEKLFLLWPNLRKPLDEATQKEFEKFYASIIPIAYDEAAVTAIAAPFVKRMWESKQISQPYWWRFSEALMDVMEAHHMKTATFSGREHGARSLRVVIERVTKISYNTMNEWCFASDDFTSPHKFDVCGHRAVHESGFW